MSLPWLVAGDFNELLSLSEKYGVNECSSTQLTSFAEVIDDCGLMDLGYIGPTFTWRSSLRTQPNIQETLDRALATIARKDIYPRTQVCHNDFFGSDHRALNIIIGGPEALDERCKRSSHFKFEPFWRSSEFPQIVAECWTQACFNRSKTVSDLRDVMMSCGQDLKSWGNRTFSNLFQTK